MKKLFRWLVVLIILGIVAISLYAWVKGRGKNDKGITLVDVQMGSITDKALAVGQIEPRQKFQIKAKVNGLIKTCLVQVGDKVKPGDPLFEIAPDPTPQDMIDVDRNLESSRASFVRAKADFDRYQQLFDQGVVAKGDLDAKHESYDLAQVSLQRAKENRELTVVGRVSGGGAAMETIIRSPAAGTVLTKAVNPGDPVVPLTSFQPGTELATVADMGDLIFRGTVDEIDVGKMHVGLPARIKVGALPTDVVTGKVSRIAPQAQKKDGATLFDVEAELDPNTQTVLRAGYSANADVIIKEKKDILVIPERLVIFEQDGKKTYVEVPGSSAKAEPKKVEVTTGLSDGLNIEVTAGLQKGDKVVQRPPKEIT